VQQETGCRLAVGPGHADHAQARRGVAVEGRCHVGQRGARVGDDNMRHGRGVSGGGLAQYSGGPARQGRVDEAMPVNAFSVDGHEEVARPHGARVVDDASDRGVTRADQRGVGESGV